MKVHWDDFRNESGEIHLAGVYEALYGGMAPITKYFLEDIQCAAPIKSRQISALAVRTARELAELHGVKE